MNSKDLTLFYSLLISQAISLCAFAETNDFKSTPSTQASQQVAALSLNLRVEGLKRTKIQVIEQEINLLKEELVENKVIPISNLNVTTPLKVDFFESYFSSSVQLVQNEIKQRILNTGLFSSVTTEYSDRENDIHILVSEKWTTIPIFKFSSGGGTQVITLGVYDPNAFGRRLELGIQYEKLGEADSAVTWFKNPRVFGTRNFIDFQHWDTKRIRLKYDQQDKDPNVIKGFLLKSRREYLSFGHEWTDLFKTALTLERHDDRFTEELLSNSVLNQVRGQELPPATSVNFLGTTIEYGKLNQKDENQLGTLSSLRAKYGFVEDSIQSNFFHVQAELLHYQTVVGEWIWGQRIRSGTTDTETLQFWNYFGGLDSIRGFSDNRFAGRHFWLSNTEFRHPILRSSNWIIQGNLFLDTLGLSESGKNLEDVKAASAGMGLRLIAPKVYRLVVRLDFARPIIKDDDMAVSLGLQQFF